jgi:hypothetical protein
LFVLLYQADGLVFGYPRDGRDSYWAGNTRADCVNRSCDAPNLYPSLLADVNPALLAALLANSGSQRDFTLPIHFEQPSRAVVRPFNVVLADR